MAEPEVPNSPTRSASDVGGDSSARPSDPADLALVAMLGAGARRSTGPWQPPSPQDLQRSFPQFRIGELLGRGGMGAVYTGWQKSLDRQVAIKILPPERDDGAANFAERFKREGHAMARFNHPGIVHVYDAGETNEGLLYLIMEYVEGTDLQKLLVARGSLPPDQALDIASRVCDALAYAHRHGVIHRDIKPSNVMIDTEGNVKVADFGLAKVVTSSESAALTSSQISMGTRDYMAPEQSTSMNVDQRADIYSLGVVLYEMLCREPPKGVFDPPSHRTGCDVRIDHIVMRAMHQRPDRRYQSTEQMRADLEAARTPLSAAQAAGRAKESAPLPSQAAQRGASDAAAAGQGWQTAQVDATPTQPPEAAASRPVLPSAPKKSRLPLYAGLAAVVVVIAATAFLWPRTKAGAGPFSSKAGGPASHARPTPVESVTPATATTGQPFINSLGMKFIPVPILGGPTNGQRALFSVWDTRVQDYEAFVKETKRLWPRALFPQGPTHPAVMMTWDDAQLFCQWLTAHDQAADLLPADWRYRLPSDHEWSCAVGLGRREDPWKLPAGKGGGKINDAFPWGTEWPPPKGAGNYAGEEMRPAFTAHTYNFVNGVIDGYDDGFVNTSPVGSFTPNQFGLFDLGGNVMQWCEDWFDNNQNSHLMRGGSWCFSGPASLLSSARPHIVANGRRDDTGFRCVLSRSSP